MIKIEKKSLPKEYERAIIEEYYNLYKERDGFPFPATKDLRWTSDLSRLRKRDLRNMELMKAIESYTSIENSDIEFICYGPEDVVTAIARVMITAENIHILEMLFLNYPTLSEKFSYIKNLIDITNLYGFSKGCKTISCEAAKNDGVTMDLLVNMGFDLTPELVNEASCYTTYILEKNITEKNEQTRCR